MTITNAGITILAKELYDVRAEKEQLEDRLKQLNGRKEELEKQIIPQLMEDMEQSKVTVVGIGTIYLKPELNCYVKKEVEQEFFDWLRANNQGDIIKETVHHGTLKSWAKEQLENGAPLPPQMESHQFMQAVLRRS
jgi:predicted nuclease with TOPRIM domain